MVEKYEKDGKVAVLVSPGYGAGWSSWCSSSERELQEQMLFDPVLVELLLSGEKAYPEIERYVQNTYAKHCYTGGLCGLEVQWVPKGCRFRVNEYDGSESIERLEYIEFYEA